MALDRFLKRSYSDNIVYKCCLKSVDNKLLDIHIKTNAPFYIGRSEETGIQDTFCSRKQILLTPDLQNALIKMEVHGINLSSLNGNILENNKTYNVKHNDVIDVIHGRFQYKILFDPVPDYENSLQNSVSKKSKQESSTSSTKRKFTWETIGDMDLIICTTDNVESSEKIASYDLDGTLIKTKSGNVHPKDCSDWQIAYTEASNKLNKYLNQGFKIVIFTNQAPLGHGRVDFNEFKEKIEAIITKLNVPIQVFIAPNSNLFRKPRIGMWEYLENNKNDGKLISKNESFYVGDAAGRFYEEKKKIKKDHSCADRLFALNIEIQFFTPEEHFLNEKATINYKLPEFNPKEEIDYEKLSSSIKKIEVNYQQLIVLVGLPGSGKSYISNTILKNNFGYSIVNRDTLGTIEKCVKLCESILQKGDSCVIDNTNLDIESRKRFIKIAKKMSVKCRCVLMNVPFGQIRHNLTFRELTDSKHIKVKDLVFYSLKKKYVEPTMKEGFDEIIKIDAIPPKFDDNNSEKLYKMYLVDK